MDLNGHYDVISEKNQPKSHSAANSRQNIFENKTQNFGFISDFNNL